jgi:flagellar basal-body rod modification protein FlgD
METKQTDASQVLDQYSVNRFQKSNKKDESNQANKNQFMELMIAQLKNQNPLDPKDGGAFLAQLAQFSTVDGIERLNGTMGDMAGQFKSNQALQASSLVGRKVLVPSEIAQYSQNIPVKGVIDLPSSAASVKLEIKKPSGELVREISLGTHEKGELGFTWDGLDAGGAPMPGGRYKVTASSLHEGENQALSVFLEANVDSVTLAKNGGVLLNLENQTQVPMSDIKHIR